MITVEALKDAIHARIDTYNQTDYPLSQRRHIVLPLAECGNHVLAEYIISPFDVPRQNVSAMDGFAIAKGSNLSAGSSIEIIGESQAGNAYMGSLAPNQGVRIFTGAVIPDDCDTIEMQENTNHAEIKATLDKSQPYNIVLSQEAQPDNHIRRQGEEIKQDEVLLQAGKRLNPADISLLANLGIAEVQVYTPLKVGIVATGDELVSVGEALTSLAQIYNSNTPTLKSLLDYAKLPISIQDYGIIPDNLEQTQQAIARAMTECDVLISTAGVSVGDYDFLTTVIEQLGQINHYKVAMKPGKPFVFGELTHNLAKPVMYFGLPGNPLSTVVGSLQFVIPALWQLTGCDHQEIPRPLTVQARLTTEAQKSPGRADYQRGQLSQDDSGRYQVAIADSQQSHRIKQLSQANCLVVLDKDSESLPAGSMVEVQPFFWTLA